jgi:alpha-tubulin suppressor-like RCC1 family protein
MRTTSFAVFVFAIGCGANADRLDEPRLEAGPIADAPDASAAEVAPPPDAPLDLDAARVLLPGDPVEVSLGYTGSCARTRDGHVRCWGTNSNYEVGDGTTETRNTPTAVPGLDNVVQIAAMHYNACAVIADGTVRCWGTLGWGLRGDGDTVSKDLVYPPRTIPKLTGVTRVGGSSHACALLTDRTVMCWGFNPFGELGYATTIPASESDYTCAGEPATVPDLTGVRALAPAVQHNCALNDHGVWCWGWNQMGQLGDGTTTSRYQPKQIVGLDDVVQLSAHHSSSCALRKTGGVMCWGARYRNDDYNFPDKMTVPYEVKGFSGAVAEVIAGGPSNCARMVSGTVQCWGARLGASAGSDLNPVTVKGLDHVVHLALGNGRACAIRDDASLWCWGRYGPLGDAAGTQVSTVPLKVDW